MSKESLQKAVDLAGGQAHLARGIREHLTDSKIGQVHVWGWLNTVKIEVPPGEVVLPIVKYLDYQITPHQLRPDLYPNPGDGLPMLIPTAIEDRRVQDQRVGERRLPGLFGHPATVEDEKPA